MRGIQEDRGEGRIVLDDEDEHALAEFVTIVVDLECRRERGRNDGPAIVVARGRSGELNARFRSGLQGNVQGKGRPFTGLRSNLQLAAEEAGDFTADRKTKPRAAIFAAGRSIGLLESFENQLLLVLRNADAGVGDGDLYCPACSSKSEVRRAPTALRRADGQSDTALRGELESVREEVEHDLLEPLLVGPDGLR